MEKNGLEIEDFASEASSSEEEGEVRALSRAYAAAAVRTLVSVMLDEGAGNGDRIRAANLVLERAYGKADGASRRDAAKRDRLDDIRAELERLKEGLTR